MHDVFLFLMSFFLRASQAADVGCTLVLTSTSTRANFPKKHKTIYVVRNIGYILENIFYFMKKYKF